MSIEVKVGTIPGVVREVMLNGERTVRAAVELAGINPAGYTVTVNGSSADLDTTLDDGDRVLLTKNAKGA